MAKVNAPLLSLTAKGTIARKLVFLKTRGQPYARSYAVPTDQRTAAQASVRNVFAFADRLFMTAPDDTRAPWIGYVVGRVQSPHNAFDGRFVRDNHGQSNLNNLTLSPGANGGLSIPNFHLLGGSNNIIARCDTPPTPTGWTFTRVMFALMRDQSPETGELFEITERQDLGPPFSRNFTGLLPGEIYQVSGWAEWVKPNGTPAYGPSSLDQRTPT